jgi:hypothetical protein
MLRAGIQNTRRCSIKLMSDSSHVYKAALE